MDPKGIQSQPPSTPPQPPPNRAAPLSPAPHLRGVVFDPSAVSSGSGGSSDDFKKKRLPLLLIAALALFCAYTIGCYVTSKNRQPVPLGPFAVAPASKSVKVQVVGRVRIPGLYTLANGERIQDAIDQAGGALPDADLDALNLATWVTDGSRIEVPARQKQGVPVDLPPVGTTIVASPTAAMVAVEPLATSPSAPGSEVPTEAGDTSAKTPIETLKANPLDLNKASAAELTALPGVGPKMAQRIVDYRTSSGPFQSVDGLDNVKGFGAKRVEELRELVTVK